MGPASTNLLTYFTYSKLDEEITRLYPELSGEGRSFQTQIGMCYSLPGMTLIETPPTLNTQCGEVLSPMVPAMRSMFPLVGALVQVLLVNPASSATAELAPSENLLVIFLWTAAAQQCSRSS